ncbi:MAG: tryptophan-rich sensory protein [Planctomycetota bacterium]|nr:tryptophan-rich sensory protein [Planctomycetota bacterium]
MPRNLREWLALAAFGALCAAAAFTSRYFTLPALESGWYATQVEKPWWTPPGWVFGPVWGVLYVLMAVSGWVVWKDKGLAGAPLAFFVYFLQLAVNAAWSFFFFHLRNPGAAFFELLLLWLMVAVTAGLFEHVRKRSGWLLLPYLAWVSFAVALNFQIWRLNWN